MPQCKTYLINARTSIEPRTTVAPRASRAFTAADVKNIYRFPNPIGAATVGVISLGGYLNGTIHPTTGILTGGDIQAYWTSIGIPASNHPVIKVVRVDGTQFVRNDVNATIENAIDIEMLGACCPTSQLTIVFYYSDQMTSNTADPFYNIFNYAINTPVSVNGSSVIPSVISCSWGAPESLFTHGELAAYNSLFAVASAKGITITCAAGDYGSSDGTAYTVVDFPASSPNVVACGGTTLVCPDFVYNAKTVETTWSLKQINGTATGGGVSNFFKGPPLPTPNSTLNRQIPDVSLVADPNTGVAFRVDGAMMVVGGTSIVSPAIAGLVAALNPGRALLPMLYALPSTAFYDITVGQNGAYRASPGYDRCTGIGSVNGAVFGPAIRSLSRPVAATLPAATSVRVGSSVQLSATRVTWLTANSAIATVSQTGLLSGVAPGVTTLTATTLNGFLVSSTTVTVLPSLPTPPAPPPAPKSTIKINGPIVRRAPRNSTSILSVSVTGSTSPVSWKSSNTLVATVVNGVVTTTRFIGATLITGSIPGGPNASIVIQTF